MHIGIVFNPGSGVRAARGALGEVTSAIASHNHTLEVFDRAVQPDFERAISAHAHEFDRVVVIGGDGTLNGVVNGVMASEHPEIPVAFVPTGRGKDTARSLRSWKPQQLTGGAFEAAAPIATDLIRVELASAKRRYCMNVANIGLAAHAAVLANGLPRWLGTGSYIGGAVRAIVPPRAFTLEVAIDGEDISDDNALLLSVCNGRSFGGGVYIAPEADTRDGLLDIVIAHNANLGDLALQLPKLKSGTPFEHDALKRLRGCDIIVRAVASPWYDIDGEQLASQPVRFTVMPGALNWIGPA
ncbi:MAG: YegS/Rv2252/BmrU family lipid kinase [Thermomicrobiales bacterium]|nr:YegS/Rv2252/BmrU family lipid kinase [Thermomicrobiales bacterium]